MTVCLELTLKTIAWQSCGYSLRQFFNRLTMSEELIELIKIHTNSEPTTKLNTRENAHLLASKLTGLIIGNQQNKTKVQKCLRFIHNLASKHSKLQCPNKDNVSTYLKHLKITTIHETKEDLHVKPVDINHEINAFYAHQASVKSSLNKRREFIKLQTQQSLPPDFLYNLSINEGETNPFQLNIIEQRNNANEQSEIQRESAVKLAMAVINLNENSSCVIPNILSSLSQFDELLTCEKDFLKWLLLKGKFEAVQLIDTFPFLLEEELIDIAIKHIQGNFDVDKDLHKYEWIQSDVKIKKHAFDISQALFSLSKHNLKVLDVLTKVLQ